MIISETQSENINKARSALAVEQLRGLLMLDKPSEYDDERSLKAAILAQALVTVEARGIGNFDSSCVEMLDNMDLTREHIVAARRAVANSAIVAPF